MKEKRKNKTSFKRNVRCSFTSPRAEIDWHLIWTAQRKLKERECEVRERGKEGRRRSELEEREQWNPRHYQIKDKNLAFLENKFFGWRRLEREGEGEGGRQREREERRDGWITFFKGINKLSECSCYKFISVLLILKNRGSSNPHSVMVNTTWLLSLNQSQKYKLETYGILRLYIFWYIMNSNDKCRNL